MRIGTRRMASQVNGDHRICITRIEEDRHREDVKMWSTWAGIGLCVVLFFYLTHLAKRALARAQAEQERDGEGEAFAIERL